MAKTKEKLVFNIPVDEYRDHADSYDGICVSCGEWTSGGCEPDARCYPCDACGARKVYGAEEAMMMGYLNIAEC